MTIALFIISYLLFGLAFTVLVSAGDRDPKNSSFWIAFLLCWVAWPIFMVVLLNEVRKARRARR